MKTLKILICILFISISFLLTAQTNDTVCIIEHVGMSDKPISTIIFSKNKIPSSEIKISLNQSYFLDYLEAGTHFYKIIDYVNASKNNSDSNTNIYGTFKIILASGNTIINSYYIDSKHSRLYFTRLTENCCGMENSDLIKY